MSRADPPLPPPPPSGASSAARPGADRRVRWGIGDVIAAFAVGVVVSALVGVAIVDPDHPNRPNTLIVLVCVQNVAIIAWLAMVARRKGTGTLRRDFGLELRRSGAAWLSDARYFFLGIALQLVAFVPIGILEALHGDTARQDVVKSADQATGWQIPALALAIVLLAPVTEELLFRGTLLRSLLRKTSATAAVFVSALAFGLVHALGDPSIGTLIALPAIVLLGVVSGYEAARTGNLSRSILLHVGFNALTVVFLFTT